MRRVALLALLVLPLVGCMSARLAYASFRLAHARLPLCPDDSAACLVGDQTQRSYTWGPAGMCECRRASR